jgi:hypothetical protein
MPRGVFNSPIGGAKPLSGLSFTSLSRTELSCRVVQAQSVLNGVINTGLIGSERSDSTGKQNSVVVAEMSQIILVRDGAIGRSCGVGSNPHRIATLLRGSR